MERYYDGIERNLPFLCRVDDACINVHNNYRSNGKFVFVSGVFAYLLYILVKCSYNTALKLPRMVYTANTAISAPVLST